MALHHLGKVGVLGQEAVAGVDRLRAGDQRGGKDRGLVQIAVPRGGRSDAHAFIGQAHMHRVGIGGGMHGDGGDAEVPAGAEYPERDFAAIGDQDFFEHRRQSDHSMIISGSSYSTGAPAVTSTFLTTPAFGALIWLKVFIASISSSVWPASTLWPTLTYGAAPGSADR